MDLNLAIELGTNLLTKHGLTAQGWAIRLDRAVTRLGQCNYATKTITLAYHATLVNGADIVNNTILHEIAHALVGPGQGHGLVWKLKAKEIGCDASRTGQILVKAPHKYELHCASCSRMIRKYYRRPHISLTAYHPCAQRIAGGSPLYNLIVKKIAK